MWPLVRTVIFVAILAAPTRGLPAAPPGDSAFETSSLPAAVAQPPLSPQASPDDIYWDDRFGSGVDNVVNALAIGPDGSLFVAGSFTFAGGTVAVQNIARLGNDGWSALGSGLNGSVNALAVDAAGNLYAGGSFTTAGGVSANRIAVWDGVDWSPMGSGMNDAVMALAVDASGNLFAGGAFTTAGDSTANHIAMWDGSGWSDLDPGLPNGDVVFSLSVDSGGDLFVGGLVALSRWDGSTWSPLGTGVNGVAYALLADGGDLYAAGSFTLAVGIGANHVARWDGTAWSALGTGLGGTPPNNVYALARDAGGNLFAGGQFSTAGGASASHVAMWDGSTWSPLGDGLTADGFSAAVKALVTDGSTLYAGGTFSRVGEFPGLEVGNLARWSDATWTQVGGGPNVAVLALAADGTGGVYAGGSFDFVGAAPISYLARWNGSHWSALGTGLSYAARALAVDPGGSLYAGGSFAMAGGEIVNGIAEWDGASWSPLGSGMSHTVTALAIDGSGDLYAGGYFTTAGGVSANHVAKWDGIGWSPLGSGISGPVFALAVDESGNLYAGGTCTMAGGVSAENVAMWNGSIWSPLGSGVNGDVQALALDDSGNLYAGGNFTMAGVMTTGGIARWDGSLWSALGPGPGSGVTYSLAFEGGEILYAGGDYGAKKWNGSSWSNLGSGGGLSWALATTGPGYLYAGGWHFFGIWTSAFLISASAGIGGSITPSGTVAVTPGNDQLFTITPDPGFELADVVIDEVSVGPVNDYLFPQVQAAHTIAAVFDGQTAVGPVPVEFSLSGPIPNPSRGTVQIEYSLAHADPVRLDVVDISGRSIAVLVDGTQGPGSHRVDWRGATATGRAPAGIYFVRYAAPGFTRTRRLVFLR